MSAHSQTPGIADLFSDPDVDQARKQNGEIRLRSGRTLMLPRAFGFCAGVMRALRMLDTWIRVEVPGNIHLLGPIIHNDTVNNAFREQGVNILPENDIEAVFRDAESSDRIVLPAFGVPVEVEERLRQAFLDENILDTTCPYVRRVWAFLSRLRGGGWTVAVHGKAGHPETRATVSRALRVADTVLLVPSEREVDLVCEAMAAGGWHSYPTHLRRGDAAAGIGPIALVNQTTMLYDDTLAIARQLSHCAQRAGLGVTLADTVCRATQERQHAAAELCARRPDVVLVVGGFTSSNTAQLYRLAIAATETFFIDGAASLSPQMIVHYVPGDGILHTESWLPTGWKRLGLLAGASCPASDIGAVIRRFRSLDDEL